MTLIMNNYIDDLNLRKEIFPIFDNCINYISQKKLYNILEEPLKSIKDIYNRQKIIKGFILSSEVLSEYKYSKVYFHQIYEFLLNFTENDLIISKTVLIFSKKLKLQIESKLIQIISVFSKIEYFLSKINRDDFPPKYYKEILYMLNFLSIFNLKEYNNKNLKINDIIFLSKKIISKKNDFFYFFDKLLEFEVYTSISTSIIRNNFIFPTFSENEVIFEGLYHPLLDNPISNDISFYKNVIILTGPNMSGKSTFLKSLFINIYLGHLGLAIPSKKASFPFFEYFSISINHNDNLKKGYSHFMNEIKLLKKALVNSNEGKRCFIIFDELFKGTNIDDAFLISSQTISGLLNFKESFFIISTHIQLLNQIDDIKNNLTGNYYIDSSLEGNIPKFSYKLKEGWSNLKIGEILFKNEGIKSLLNR